MIELPEAVTLAAQISESLRGKSIVEVVGAKSPHKFAWFHGNPGGYGALLRGKRLGVATSYGGLVSVDAGDAQLLFGDGVALRLHQSASGRPDTHQLLLVFDDSSALSASVQMYGGVWAFRKGDFENKYYEIAREAPSPLSGAFDAAYFSRLTEAPALQKLSAKALLATEQRVPGLGNGVLQDILYGAGIHPKKKVSALSRDERKRLFHAVKSTLSEMARLGGRDTEKDLYGRVGAYRTRLSKNTVGQPCPECGSVIRKESYLGGAIYFCAGCQHL